MSAGRTTERAGRKICAVCGRQSDLSAFISMNESERERSGLGCIRIKLCASCAGALGVSDRLAALIKSAIDNPKGPLRGIE